MISDATIKEAPAIHACRSSWTETVERHFAALPKRWLFRNERVNIMLTGLRRGEVLMLGPWPHGSLLVVTFGELRFITGDSELDLQETDSTIVTPHIYHELRASDTVDFLLMNFGPPNARWLNRRLCHGTAGRNEMLQAAREPLRVHAQL